MEGAKFNNDLEFHIQNGHFGDILFSAQIKRSDLSYHLIVDCVKCVDTSFPTPALVLIWQSEKWEETEDWEPGHSEGCKCLSPDKQISESRSCLLSAGSSLTLTEVRTHWWPLWAALGLAGSCSLSVRLSLTALPECPALPLAATSWLPLIGEASQVRQATLSQHSLLGVSCQAGNRGISQECWVRLKRKEEGRGTLQNSSANTYRSEQIWDYLS